MFDAILINPIINLVVLFYHGLTQIHVPFALGFAIILMTTVIKLVLYPMTKLQLKSAKQMQDIAPEIAKLKEKYKNDTKKQQLAQMELFRKNGVNPLAGCLPALVQIPFFFGLYWALDKIVKAKAPADLNGILYAGWLKLEALWDTTFFGLPLGKTPSELLPTLGYGIVLVAVVTGLLQLIQSKMMTPAASTLPTNSGPKGDDIATALQKQMMFMLPVMIGFFSFTFPIGITLYWNTFTIFGIIQQYKVSKWGGLEDWFKYLKK